ncbi:ACP S-malonyltransferase [Paenibacillus apiarius]|uniref:[acyl-carrier-protein] S-malonyltransferase n=1 Tax=Paenibacillus apiarius TaxID=46240 RepID=A0ABT4DXT6_9BACL|nr:ACP S-malonyltransferase [Paenibacillus apiarius]MCY9517596.1 ACP S-malonyltransferase [Paenibacillus apiarius]MCY9522144.1 ACP S-malonyltransferase [Paenibacillus apiarius]MCY9554638.1 ACP S-malonyltransferase [Paenibacillus apiarius]MCY9559216.1 ACP S-malonyltransferase [Paenibacillus apiarius]MCY9683639.1 ACP S-malonyltransferase [Paenibacillus apiarius]
MHNIAILLPGIGSQYLKMGKSMYDNYASAKRVYDIADECLGYHLRERIMYGDIKEFNDKTFVPAAILTTSIAFFTVFQDVFNIKADYYAGRNIGELSALVCSGAIDFSDALHFIVEHSEINLSQNDASNKEEISFRLQELIAKLPLKRHVENVVTAVEGIIYTDSEDIVRLMLQPYTQTRWKDTIRYMTDQGIYRYIEIGPSNMLRPQVLDVEPAARVLTMDHEGDPYYSTELFKKKKLFNKTYLLSRMLGVAVSVPNNNFDDMDYLQNVVTPYNQLKDIYDKYSSANEQPSDLDMADASRYFMQIMHGKKTDANEINLRLSNLQEETLIEDVDMFIDLNKTALLTKGTSVSGMS